MSDQEVMIAVRLRMCAEVFEAKMACIHHNQDTVCGAALDTYGLHALMGTLCVDTIAFVTIWRVF